MEPRSLLEVLSWMPDPRSRHGRVYPLSAVLGLVTLALLMGRTSLAGVARFGRQYGLPLAHALGFRSGNTPTVSTLSRTLRRFDPGQLERLLAQWVRGRIGEQAFESISVDGKTLRGSRHGDIPGHHLVAAYAPAASAVLAQLRVDAKTNEHKAALELLGILPVKGKVVVADAMFCQRDLAERIVAFEGDYVLLVKDNQPGLQADIQASFGFETAARAIAAATSPEVLGSSAPPDRVAHSVDKGHGRLERRTLRTTRSLTLSQLWRGLKQGFELTRERTIRGVKTVEVVYGITSLSGDRADASTLLKLVRGHWQIENELHYVRDVTLREDACRVRCGNAPPGSRRVA